MSKKQKINIDLVEALEAVVPGRTDGAVGHNRKCVALWLALYGHYYNFDAPHLYGWCIDNADTNDGGLLLVGYTPGDGHWFLRLFPGWEGDIQTHWFNEFDINDLIAAHKAGDLVEYTAITKVHNLYAAITTQQYRAKFNEMPLQKEWIDGEKPAASSKGKKTRQKRFRLVK